MLSNKINKAQATHYFEDKNIVLKGRFAELLFKLEQDLQEIKELASTSPQVIGNT